jgi:hypothetical protein
MASGGFQRDTKSTGEPPGNDRATKADEPGLAPGVRVQITAGMAAGVVGVIASRWPRNFGGEPQWVVASEDLTRKRVVRDAYLRVVPT